jgi:hypothetical protein
VNQNQGGVMAVLGGMLICIGIFLLIILGIYIFFCVSMQRTMSAVRPKNRKIAPGLVWLHMMHLGGAVPIIGILFSVIACVWDLIMVLKIAESLRKEYKSRGWRVGTENFGKTTGLVWTIGGLLGLPVGVVIGFLGDTIDQDLMGIIGLALIAVLLVMFICFIIYWVQIHGYGTKLIEAGGGRRRTAEEEDYDEDYQPRRGRSRRRDEDDDDEDDAPRSRRRRDDDDDEEEDRPRRRRRVEDDEDDEDRPRRRRRDEDDD